MNKIKIFINNRKLKVNKNYNIIQACNENNINIPKFCYHQELSIAGNCRMCLVEVKGINKPIASCAIPVSPDMSVYTNSKLVKKAREGILEFILINHPLDCPICDQGGECDLQDQSLVFGSDRGRFYEYKRSVNDKDCGPFIKTIMTRCIHCTRCVRFLDEVSGFKYLGLIGRGSKIEISNFINKVIFTEFSGNIVDLCPVGALTLKTYAFKARPWELSYFNGLDLLDPFHINIRVDIRDLTILRILPVYNNILKQNWITDITRYSYDGFNNFRLLNPLINKEGKYLSLSWLKTYKFLSKILISNNINFILGNFLDIETSIILKKIYSLSSSNITINYSNLLKQKNNDFRSNFFWNNYNLQNLLNYDNIVLIDSNIRLSNPLLNLKIKNFCKIKNYVFSIGTSFYSNFLIYNYGNNLKEFKTFLKGQSDLNLLLKDKKTLLVINENIIFNSNYNLNWLYLLKNIKKYLNIDIFFYNSNNSYNSGFQDINLNNSISKFNDHTFVLNNNSNKKTINNIFYFINTNYKTLSFINNNNNFLIYQGSNFNLNKKNVNYNMFLPSVNFLEKNSTYVNFLGYYQKTKFILYPPKNSRSDWKIIYILFNFLMKNFKNFNFSSFSKIKLDYNMFYNDRYYNLFSIKLIKNLKYSFKLVNNFNNNNNNIYNSNVITLSSKNIYNIFKKVRISYSNFY